MVRPSPARRYRDCTGVRDIFQHDLEAGEHVEGKLDYIDNESENQKFGLIILLVLFHSACPYKNYCLKCFT